MAKYTSKFKVWNNCIFTLIHIKSLTVHSAIAVAKNSCTYTTKMSKYTSKFSNKKSNYPNTSAGKNIATSTAIYTDDSVY